MHDSKPMDIPIEKGLSLSVNQCPKIDNKKERIINVPYTSAVESLIYAMLCTWPNICFTIDLVSHHQSNPGPTHWHAIKRIFCYLYAISYLVLCYQGGDLKLSGYLDAN